MSSVVECCWHGKVSSREAKAKLNNIEQTFHSPLHLNLIEAMSQNLLFWTASLTINSGSEKGDKENTNK